MRKLLTKHLDAIIGVFKYGGGDDSKAANASTRVTVDMMKGFAIWIGENGYNKHQVNDRWYSDEQNDFNYIGSTNDLLYTYLKTL